VAAFPLSPIAPRIQYPHSFDPVVITDDQNCVALTREVTSVYLRDIPMDWITKLLACVETNYYGVAACDKILHHL
jgi:hypothetical protein